MVLLETLPLTATVMTVLAVSCSVLASIHLCCCTSLLGLAFHLDSVDGILHICEEIKGRLNSWNACYH